MNYVLTPKQMQEVDRYTEYELLIPSILLMEHAALAVTTEVIRHHLQGCKVLVIAGRGNNGGDGLAVARQLLLKGYAVKILLCCQVEDLTVDSTVNYQTLRSIDANIEIISELTETVKSEIADADVVIDALFGTGCNRMLTSFYAEMVEAINQFSQKIIAIDIPSGLNGKSGIPMSTAVKADKTVVLSQYKLGNLLGKAKHYCGEMVLADIGIPAKALQKLNSQVFLLTPDCWENYPVNDVFANKGSQGKLAVIAGCSQMGGALLLSAEAAYRSGVGLVYAYTSESNRIPLLTRLPEAIVNTYHDKSDRYDFYKIIEDKNAVLIGPGLSTNGQAYELLQMAISSNLPLVIDADALNLMAEHPKLLHLCMVRSELKILTPHIKEMERLTGISIPQIEANMVEVAQNYAEKWNAVIILKNHRTVIAFPNGKCYINLLGNEGMATGGSGDVLSGYLAGLIASCQNSEYEKAVLYGVYHHSLAGDMAMHDKGTKAMLASDIISKL
ncbi:MAG: NAD(P)H-hydrate dehydratase [Eubacteriales bacterium]|nr:NAD(P)H-hydrate dehydratase [Eubacteriales bacterium]